MQRHVVIASNQPIEMLEPICDAIRRQGGSASAVVADVTDDAATRKLIDDIVSRYSRIDWVVNSAGIYGATPIFETNRSHIQRLMDVNFIGSVNVMLNTLPHMRAQGGGQIVNIASSGAILGQTTTSGYAASKAAIAHFTSTIAPELAGTGIRANCVAPGAVRTPMTALYHSPETPEAMAARQRIEAISSSPHGQAFADPEDIASIVLFLLSDASRLIPGACIVADQGRSAALTDA